MTEEQATVKDVLLSLGYKPKEIGSQYYCQPLYRASDNDKGLTVNKDSGLWYDFRECYGGALRRLVELTLKVSRKEAVEYLEERSFNPEIHEEEYIEQVKTWPVELLKKLGQDHRYWEKRGIPSSVTSLFRGGVAKDGRMAYRYVFPIFDEFGSIIGFNGRDLFEEQIKGRVKWKVIGAKKNFCYPYYFNKEEIKKTKEVILVESIGDMLSLWSYGVRNALVVFGLNLSPVLIKSIIKSSPNRIIIACNNDSDKEKNWGMQGANKMRVELANYFDSDKIELHLPESNDFNAMTEEEFRLWKQKVRSSPLQG